MTISTFLFETEDEPKREDVVLTDEQKPSVESLHTTLNSLQAIRDSHKRGTKDRHIYSMACNRLKELINRRTA